VRAPPAGWYENFITGFWAHADSRAEVWGRPADITLTLDGSLLIADDTGGTIWRVRAREETPPYSDGGS